MLFMPMYIYQQASTLQNWPFAAAISMIFLVAVLAVRQRCSTCSAACRAAMRRREAAPDGPPATDASTRCSFTRVDVAAWPRWRCLLLLAPTVVVIVGVVHRRLLAEVSAAGLFAALVRGAARCLAAAVRRREQLQGRAARRRCCRSCWASPRRWRSRARRRLTARVLDIAVHVAAGAAGAGLRPGRADVLHRRSACRSRR